MKNKITVFVNDQAKALYPGLHVKNAIGAKKARLVLEHRLVVRDQDGNIVDVDGALYDGERLYTAATDPATFTQLHSNPPK